MAADYIPNDRLVEVLGLPLALRLLNAFGGCRVYLPHPSRMQQHSQVAVVLGLEAARTLAGEWPQTHVMLPKGAPELRRQRDRAIRADKDKLSVRELAMKFDTTERHVYRVLACEDDGDDEPAARFAAAQGRLF